MTVPIEEYEIMSPQLSLQVGPKPHPILNLYNASLIAWSAQLEIKWKQNLFNLTEYHFKYKVDKSQIQNNEGANLSLRVWCLSMDVSSRIQL